MTDQSYDFCCKRFEEAVHERVIIRSEAHEETDWYIGDHWYIYFCPFCGADVRGGGWGEDLSGRTRSEAPGRLRPEE